MSILDDLVPHAVFHLTGHFTDTGGKVHETIQLLNQDRRMVASVTFEDGEWTSYWISSRLDTHKIYFRNIAERMLSNPHALTLCREGKCRGMHWDV